MTNPPPRKRFQIHLSTAIVLMFVAGVVLWANINPRRVEDHGSAYLNDTRVVSKMTEFEFRASDYNAWSGHRIVEHGWPFDAVDVRSDVILYSARVQLRNTDPRVNPRPTIWRTGPIIYNALIAVGVLFSVWLLLEWLTRRRAARKGA